MKTTIIKNTKENGCKVYTLKYRKEIICSCNDFDKIFEAQKYYDKLLTKNIRKNKKKIKKFNN